MTTDVPSDAPVGSVHRFTLNSTDLAPYYGTGDYLKNKHTATSGAADAFPGWVLDQLDLSLVRRALDAGCGWGRFSVPLLSRRGSATRLVCSDVYAGMLSTARDTVRGAGLEAEFAVADIESLPFAGTSFDLVMANHVLYHLTDVVRGIRELARVLSPDGTLVATTNSDLIRVPLLEIHRAVLDELDISSPPEEPSAFSMENGAAVLGQAFGRVEMRVFEHTVHYRTVDELLTVYLNTGRYRTVMANGQLPSGVREAVAPAFAERTAALLDAEGAIAAPQRMPAFLCTGPR